MLGNAFETAEFSLALAACVFGQAEDFFNALFDDLAYRVTGMTGCAFVDSGLAAFAGFGLMALNSDMRGDLAFFQGGDEIPAVEQPVVAERLH